MNTTKPTPGPWHVTDSSWEVSTVWALDGTLIAEVRINDVADEDTQHIYEPVKEANAKLIAASPELLEALRKIKREAADESRNPVDSCNRICDLADAAISRATGATP